jgi:hypothetical protein
VPTADETLEHRTKPARTSVAAALALVCGTAALVLVLTLVLGPVGLVLGLVGLALGAVGVRSGGRPGITGRGVATAGIGLSLLAVLLAVAGALGLSFLLNDESAVARLQDRLDQVQADLEQRLPS